MNDDSELLLFFCYNKPMKLTFFGGAGDVTGANYLLESADGTKILIDCGLHQGGHYADKRNFETFAYDPTTISAVFVTHSHLDHIGLLPKLEKDGFKGTVYSTGATKDFAELMLLDSEHILSKEAEREAKPPLYVAADIERLMAHWQGIPYHDPCTVGPFVVTPFDAGHILGSASYKIEADGKVIVFSGDLGNTPAPIIRATEPPTGHVDYCLVESAYGNRTHENEDTRRETLEDTIENTVHAGGTLVIPTFAMERTQELLYHMHALFQEGRIPRVPVFIDSPLAIKLTAIYKKHESYFNTETKNIVRSGDDILNFPGLVLTLTTEQSKEINDVKPPKVVIAGSGMSNGGRILHHEQRYLPDPKSTILFVGYQAQGTLGRQILDGAKEVKIFGAPVSVRCHMVNIPGYSAHADQPRLLHWVGAMRSTLKKVFVVQGEEESSSALAAKIKDTMAIEAVVPKTGETVEL
jgi:metallo-beta-lactamase family protein